jgi:uncharacterized lipoprotein
MKPLLKILSLSLFITACAVSPQSVVIQPQTNVSGPQYGQGRAVTISVEDRRTSTILGNRGGVYQASSVITISNDISLALLQAAQATTAQLGFDGSSLAAPAHVTIMLEQLTYDTQSKNLINTVSLDAKITITTTVGGSNHTGHYRTQRSHQFPRLPDAQKNAEIINEILSTSLERGFSDISLANFLARN